MGQTLLVRFEVVFVMGVPVGNEVEIPAERMEVLVIEERAEEVEMGIEEQIMVE